MVLARLLCLLPVVTLALTRPATAQVAPPGPGSRFKEVISQPTGKNGYEELVAAAEILRTSKLWTKAEQPEATLTDKRLALNDRPASRAWGLLRQGLAKPVFSPRESLQPGTLPPELGGLRGLGRLVSVHQYVALADGRTRDAIADARLGLRLGQVVQQDSLTGGLVGVAIAASCLRPLAAHLDQLSQRDCDLLKEVCEEWLAYPSPLPRVLAAERKFVLANLADLKQKIGPTADPNGGDPLEVAARFANDYFDRQLLELKKPAWQRGALAVEEAPEFTRALLTPLTEALRPSLDGYIREEANVRMLAVHALILRSRWETGRLPGSLAELNVADLATDPFTGKLLEYEVQGRRYRLYSAGPVAANDPQALNGRKPITVVPD